jgi:hypothetical protein
MTSVAKGPKFQPQDSKGALQKFVQPDKLAAVFHKYAKKGPTFSEHDYSYQKP